MPSKSKKKQPPQPLTDDQRAIRALSIAGHSAVVLRGMSPEHVAALTELVDPQGHSEPGVPAKIREVMVEHYAAHKATSEEVERDVPAEASNTGKQSTTE